MKKTYRTGIIGLGRIGFSLQNDSKREQPASHSAAFSAHPAISLEGGFDINADKRNDWNTAYPNARAYSSLKEMAESGPWDILVVAVDEEAHLEVTQSIVDCKPGLIVMEKPIAPNYKDARKIHKICRKKNIPVAINHERRFSKDYLLAKDMIQSGRLGDLRVASAYLFSSNPAKRKGDRTKGQGALIHDGTHIIDILAFITGKKISVEYLDVAGRQKKSISGISAYGNIGSAQFTLQCGFETKSFHFELDLFFSKGRIRIGNGILSVYSAEESPYYEGFHSLIRDDSINLLNKTEYFAGMVENCVAFLSGNAPLESDIKDGLVSLEIVDTILKRI